MKAFHPAPNQPAAHAGRRFRPAGVLTSGGRLTLLILVTGLVVLAQAWQAAHRYGQHAAARAEPPLPSVVRSLPPGLPIPGLPAAPQVSTPHESKPASTP